MSDTTENQTATDVHATLNSYPEDIAVRETLHDAPPHEVYEVTFDGRRAICKLAAGPDANPAAEGRVLQFVDRETTIPVPEVLAIGSDHFVAAWHDGVPDEPPGSKPDWARVAGRCLATLHAETEGAFNRTGLPCAGTDGLEVTAHDTWTETLVTVLADCRDFLSDVGHAAPAEATIEFVREYKEVYDRPKSSVLTHGNPIPAHIGVSDDEVTGVIDFEQSLVAPSEYDFWRAVHPVTTENPEDHPIATAFYEGYTAVRNPHQDFYERGPLYLPVNAVTHLKTFFLQDQYDEDTLEDFADQLTSTVHEGIQTCREQWN